MSVNPITVDLTRNQVKSRLTSVMTERVLGRPLSTWEDMADVLNISTPPEYQIQERDSGATVMAKTSQYHFIDKSLRSRRPTVLFENGEKGGWFCFRQPEHVFKAPGILAKPGDEITEVRNMVNFGGNENVRLYLLAGAIPTQYMFWNEKVGYNELPGNRYRIDATSLGAPQNYYVYATVVAGTFVTTLETTNSWPLSNNRYTHYLFINRQLTTTERDWLQDLFQNDTWLLASGTWRQQSFWNPGGAWPS